MPFRNVKCGTGNGFSQDVCSGCPLEAFEAVAGNGFSQDVCSGCPLEAFEAVAGNGI